MTEGARAPLAPRARHAPGPPGPAGPSRTGLRRPERPGPPRAAPLPPSPTSPPYRRPYGTLRPVRPPALAEADARPPWADCSKPGAGVPARASTRRPGTGAVRPFAAPAARPHPCPGRPAGSRRSPEPALASGGLPWSGRLPGGAAPRPASRPESAAAVWRGVAAPWRRTAKRRALAMGSPSPRHGGEGSPSGRNVPVRGLPDANGPSAPYRRLRGRQHRRAYPARGVSGCPSGRRTGPRAPRARLETALPAPPQPRETQAS